MTWVTPLDWTGVVTPSAVQLTQQLQGNLLDLYTPPTCAAKRKTFLAVADNTPTDVPWDEENWDTDAMFDLGASTDIVINTAGRYLVGSYVEFQEGSGRRNATINRTPGGAIAERHLPGMSAASESALNPVAMEDFNTNDVLKTNALQLSGGSLSIRTGSRMWAMWIGE